jgi:hypothetical protein
MGVKLLFTLLCDDIRMENSGKFIVIGVYNYVITFQPTPTIAIQGGPPNRLAMQKLCLFRRWQDVSTELLVKTEIMGPDGKVVISMDTKLVRPLDDSFCQEIIQWFGPFFLPGVHRIVTTYQDGGQKQVEDSFDVRVAAPIRANA